MVELQKKRELVKESIEEHKQKQNLGEELFSKMNQDEIKMQNTLEWSKCGVELKVAAEAQYHLNKLTMPFKEFTDKIIEGIPNIIRK